MRALDDLFDALSRSRFRRSLALNRKDRDYLGANGLSVMLDHARGFVAQHATATCCRGCLAKWHGIEKGRELTAEEQAHVVAAIGRWLPAQPASADGWVLPPLI